MKTKLAVWPVLLLCGATAAVAQSFRYPEPAETRAEFQLVCDRLMAAENPFFGSGPADRLRARLAEVEDDSEIEVAFRVRLAMELMRLGEVEEASAHLETCLERMDRESADDQALYPRVIRILALVYLLLAEDVNCIGFHNPVSCILPVRKGAVHPEPEYARRAGNLYLQLMSYDPTDVQSQWLLNLSRMISGDYPEGVPEPLRLAPSALEPEAEMQGWLDIAAPLGIDAFDLGGGAIMEDFDGDGLLDIVSSSFDPCEPMKAFRNDGKGGFDEVTVDWGLDGQLGAFNIVQGDFDDDGSLDILALRGGWLGEDGRIRNSLLRNDLAKPGGRFVDVTAAAGLAYPSYPTQTGAWGDYDGDGDLDLYIGNEARAISVKTQALFGATGQAYPSQLFRNNGDGTFNDATRSAGVANQRFAKSVAWGDYDNDGDPDLYVSNIGTNRLYRNNGDGTFQDVAPDLGVDEPRDSSFVTWFFDYDNNGWLDLLVLPYGSRVEEISALLLGQAPPVGATGHVVVYHNDQGRFTDVSRQLGFERPVLPMGANYGDLDNDGWLDFYLGTGVPDPDALMPNVMYRNDEGRRFQDVTFSGGFGHLQKAHGIAFGDLDNDGDQDLYEQMGGAFLFDGFMNVLYENPGSGNSWVTLRLVGTEANHYGLGARIEVRATNGDERRSIHTLVGATGSFGGSTLQQEIGLGSSTEIESITIRWPGSGSVQVFREVEPNRFYEAKEGRPDLVPLDLPLISLARDSDGHAHQGHGGAPSPR